MQMRSSLSVAYFCWKICYFRVCRVFPLGKWFNNTVIIVSLRACLYRLLELRRVILNFGGKEEEIRIDLEKRPMDCSVAATLYRLDPMEPSSI